MIKVRAHKGGVRIGKTPKKLASICCPQCRETKADTLKATEANRKRDQEVEKRLDQKELT
jgi:4-hydroxy-3-methylbut-2-en-1-yl diphosphate synthase IspG/GcpE